MSTDSYETSGYRVVRAQWACKTCQIPCMQERSICSQSAGQAPQLQNTLQSNIYALSRRISCLCSHFCRVYERNKRKTFGKTEKRTTKRRRDERIRVCVCVCAALSGLHPVGIPRKSMWWLGTADGRRQAVGVGARSGGVAAGRTVRLTAGGQ